MRVISIILLVLVQAALPASAQNNIPLVYDQEDTGSQYPAPAMPSVEQLPVVNTLPDPLLWSDGSGRAERFGDWSRRRHEIACEIQHYEIGEKPAVKQGMVTARMDGDTLLVDVTRNGERLSLKSTIHYHDRGEYEFDRLYPELKDNGAYSEWAWGISRLIDGLQLLGPAVTRIDTRHIGVTGCSYAGKMALFCGAFDERIALTIAQEPGGGGAAAWRVSNTIDSVESLDRTDYHWFMERMRTDFAQEKTFRLPHDHHELCAMVCPRALLVLGNPDYKWLADESAYVSVNAAAKVWEQYGIADRIGYSIVGGHPHCMLPESQFPEVKAFIQRFLLGEDVKTGGVAIAPDFKGKTDLKRWIP